MLYNRDMDKKEIELLRVLKENDDRYLSIPFLCEKLEISDRTLRNTARSLQNSSDVQGAVVDFKRNNGYRLVITDDERFSASVNSFLKSDLEKKKSLPETQEDRIRYYLEKLLQSRSYVNINEILESIFISRSTFYTDEKRMMKILEDYHLLIRHDGGNRIRIEGGERNIRTCYNRICIMSRNLETSAGIRRIVESVLKEAHFEMVDYGLENLLDHLDIALLRITAGSSMDSGVPMLDHERKEVKIACRIAERIAAAFQVEMPESEVMYIAIHLIAGKKQGDQEMPVQEETVETVMDMLGYLEQTFDAGFRYDSDTLRFLIAHVEIMLERLKYNVTIENPILDEIKNQYPNAYDMAVMAGRYLGRKLNLTISDSECSHLALYIQLLADTEKKSEKKRILVVCAGGYGTSRILMKRIESRFKDMIARISTSSAFDLDEKLKEHYDLIISTVPLNRKDIPVIVVHTILSHEEIDAIEKNLVQNSDESEYVRTAFEKTIVISSLYVKNREEAVHRMIEKAASVYQVPEEFESLVLQRESFSSTAIGDLIAIPHPVKMCCSETFAVVAVLRKPVLWGKKEVKYVIMSFLEEKNSECTAAFTQVLTEFMMNKDNMRKLDANPSYDCFMKLIRPLYSAQTEEEDDIFW